MTTMTEAPAVPAPPEVPPAAADGPQAPAPDSAAPFGRTPSGRVRSKPLSGRRGRPKGRRAAARTSVIGASGSTSRPKTKPVDYRPAILRVAQIVTLPVAFRFPVDVATVDYHLRGDDTPDNPGIARALSNLAHEQPQVAAVLDKLMQVGPYAELSTAVGALVVQLLTNHKKIPVPIATKLGATDPAEIARQLQEAGEAMAAAA